MKKVLLQLGQWISRNRKKLIYGALALFVGQICFFGLGGIGVHNEVFADDPTQSDVSQQEATKKLSMLQLFHKIIYVCIYPILMVAGKVVDNSLVYGEIFAFDAVLWKLWNIVRNIANFGLGFLFIYKIFEFLLKGQKGDDIKKLLVSALIAGVGIQASWFIMAALIDVSTIATYGIGGLPMTVLEKEKESLKYNPYVLGNVLYMESDDLEKYHMYLSNSFFLTGGNSGDAKFISECETFHYSYNNSEGNYAEELILAPKMIYYKDDTNGKYYLTQEKMCHLGDGVYHFSELYTGGNKWTEVDSTSGGDITEKQNQYFGSLTTSISTLKSIAESDMQTYLSEGKILQVGDAHAGKLGQGTLGVLYTGGQKIGLDINNEWIGTGENSAGWYLPNLGDILSGNYVGVFSTLYGSLINAGTNLRLSSTSENGLYVNVLNTSLSLGHMIAIAIPLLVMVIVLIMRIGILWIAIVLSPAVILLIAFGFDKKLGDNSILKFMQIKNLLGVVFAPVVICFAISLSTVLVRIIMKVNRSIIDTGKQDILGGLIQLNVAGLGVNIGKLVGSVIGIAITWFLMWAAVKSSELGKTKIISSIEEMSKTALGSMPVIPVPGKDGKVDYMGVGTVFGLGDNKQGIISKIGGEIKSKYDKANTETVNQWLDRGKAKEEAEGRKVEAYARELFQANIQGDWTDFSVTIGEKGNEKSINFKGNELNDGQRKEIIEKINNLNEDARKTFGNTKKVSIGSEEYTFREEALVDKDNKEVAAPYQYMTDSQYQAYLTEKEYRKRVS